MSDRFDVEYLEVGDTYHGSPIEQSYFITAILAAGGEVEIDGNTVTVLKLPKEKLSDKPVEVIDDVDYLEVGDSYQGGPVELNRFISAVLGRGGEIEVDGNVVTILQLPKTPKPRPRGLQVFRVPVKDVPAPVVEVVEEEEVEEEPVPALKVVLPTRTNKAVPNRIFAPKEALVDEEKTPVVKETAPKATPAKATSAKATPIDKTKE